MNEYDFELKNVTITFTMTHIDSYDLMNVSLCTSRNDLE